jgi:enterochelin esterase family protein
VNRTAAPFLLAGALIAAGGVRAAAPAPIEATPAGFAAWRDATARAKPAERAARVAALFAVVQRTPLTAGERAVFLFRGAAKSVQLVGDMNAWVPETAPALARIAGTDMWWIERTFPADARLDYKLLVDGDSWRLDPLNPRTCEGGYGNNSELAMPRHEFPPELSDDPNLFVWPGATADLEIESKIFGGTRKYTMYVPGGRRGPEGLPTVVFLDGGDYLRFAGAARLLDALIARQIIPPVAAVFVPPVERGEEYGGNATAIAAFLADELLPALRERHGIARQAAQTAIVGPSLGGLAAARIALARPDVFGLVAGQSGAYNTGTFLSDVAREDKRAVRFHLVAGSFETALGGDPEGGNLLGAQRRLAEILKAKGYDVVAFERPEGHSWGFWKSQLGRALAWLFGPAVEPPYRRPGTEE